MSAAARRATLRALFERPGVVRIPCAYDGLSARVAQRVGFEAVAFSGNAVSASLLGLPDLGVLGMWENIEHVGRIARSLDIPVVCDADTGYGGVMNVVRTVGEFEAAGVAGIHLEDQQTPKRCGLLPQGIPVVSREEQVAKIRAAVDARESSDFLIIARTDARSMHGLEDAAARGRAYVEAGADAVLVMNADSPAELDRVAEVVGAPLVSVIQEAPPSSELTDAVLEQAGVSIALHAAVLRSSAVRGMREVLEVLYREHTTESVRDRLADAAEYNATVGLDDWLKLEADYPVVDR
jgi:2-methylisocitrate lyase-like PEP mutase family enzyme